MRQRYTYHNYIAQIDGFTVVSASATSPETFQRKIVPHLPVGETITVDILLRGAGGDKLIYSKPMTRLA